MKADKMRNDPRRNKMKADIIKNGLKKNKNPKCLKQNLVLQVAQEVKFARLLSSNEKETRDRVLRSLKKWINSSFRKQYEFKEDDFTRVWKGLFYAVWMSDKPLIQEDLCENIAGILDLFPVEQLQNAILLMKAGLKVLATEWYGIDHHRMDKFLMLVRRYLRGSLRFLKQCDWTEESCKSFAEMIGDTEGILAPKTPHYARNANSMVAHFVDCYLEEIAKISEGNIPESSLAELLRPMCAYMCYGDVPLLVVACRRLFTSLIRQSEPGLMYEAKQRAWQKMGCPPGGPDALEMEIESEDDESDKEQSRPTALDPRAGRVNTELPNMPVPCEHIVRILEEMVANISSKAHKRAKLCIQRFQALSKEQYPLRLETEEETTSVKRRRRRRSESSLDPGAEDLDHLVLRGLSRKRRKRLLEKRRAGLSIQEDLEKERQANSVQGAVHSTTNGGWSVEPVLKKTEIIKKKEIQSKKNTNVIQNKKETNPVQNKKETNPVQNKKETNPIQNKKETNPIQNKKETNPVQNKKETNSIKNKKETNPIQNKKETNPIQNKKETNPIQNKKETNPIQNKKETNPIQNKKETKPMKENNAQKENKVPNKEIANKVEKVNGEQNARKRKRGADEEVNGPEEKKNKRDIKVHEKIHSPKKVKFVLKKNSAQGPFDYYKSVRSSPKIPFDSTKKPTRTNLKVSTPSPVNPFSKLRK